MRPLGVPRARVPGGEPGYSGEVVEIPDRGPDIVALLAEDHAEARHLLEEVPGLSLEQRRDAFPYLVRTLVGHESAEELVVYPALRSCDGGGGEVAAQRLAEQHRAERLLGALEHLRIDDPSFEASLRRLADDVLEHAEAEERTAFPALLAGLGEEQRHVLAGKYLRAKRQAPTHAHPAAPHVGPVVKVAGVIDRLRDTLMLRNAPRLRRAVRTRDATALLERPAWEPDDR